MILYEYYSIAYSIFVVPFSWFRIRECIKYL
jgi:hypothetical protein